jgi:hypothetical protein
MIYTAWMKKKKKSLIALTPDINVIKLLYLSLIEGENKLENLSLSRL